MSNDKHRYFIELQTGLDCGASRAQETEIRRAAAEKFIGNVLRWLEEHDMNDKVAHLAVTALGQVHITCERDIIDKLRDDEGEEIVAIRQGLPLTESIQRISGW